MSAITKMIDRKWWILFAMALAQGTMFNDQVAVGILQPTIQKTFNISTVTMIWITNTFFLAMAIFISIGGRLGDFFQHKRVFLTGITIFLLGSFFAAFSTHITLLLISRLIQGIGMAIVIPNAVVIIIRSFGPAEKGKAMGLFIGLSLLILMLGMLPISALSERFGWFTIFWLDIFMATISGMIAYYAIKPNPSLPTKFSLDWKGLVTSTIAFSSLVYLLMQFPYLNTSKILLLCFIALFFFIACYFVEKHHTYPIIDFRIFTNKLFSFSITVAFCITLIVGLFTFDTLYYLQVLGFTPLMASILFLPNILCQIIFAPVGGLIYDKYGYQRPVLLGLMMAIIGLLVNAYLAFWHNYWLLVPGVILINMGTPFIITSVRTLALTSVNQKDQGIASGVYNVFDIFGATITLSLLTLVVISTFRHLLNNVLSVNADLRALISLDEYEKILSQSQSTTHLSELQFNQLIFSAKSAYTFAYSMGLLLCVIVLSILLFAALIIFRRVKKT